MDGHIVPGYPHQLIQGQDNFFPFQSGATGSGQQGYICAWDWIRGLQVGR